MDIWTDHADKLEQALLAKAPALVLHFLSTASPEALAQVASDALPSSSNTKAAVVAVLASRLAASPEAALGMVKP